MMNHDEIRELPELYVLGALTEDERQILEAHLTGCRACAATVRELVRVTEGLGRAVDPRDPPASLRARVLSAARSDRAALSEPVSRVPVQPEFSFLLASDGWQPHAVPGVSFKELRVDHSTRQATLLVALEPGARYPGHHHAGAEQCLVLAGDVRAGGRRLGPGDFHVAAAGSVHEEISSEHGCTIMLIVSSEDYLALS